MFLRCALAHVTAFVSTDSANWLQFATVSLPSLFQDAYIGVNAGNGGTAGYNAPEIAADFEYFHTDRLPSYNCGDVSGVWDSTGSPYYVTCDVTVPAGQTLEIRPGVQVLFTGHYKFNVFGNLQAIGTAQDSIVFTRAFPTEESRGRGIRINAPEDTCRFAYCRMAHGNALSTGNWADPSGGAIECFSAIEIDHCAFVENHADDDAGAVYVDAQFATITNSVFADNSADDIGGIISGGALLLGTNWGTPELSHCVFLRNHTDGDGGAVAFGNSHSRAAESCTFVGNSCGGSGSVGYSSGALTVFRNCIIWQNAGSPFSIGPNGSLITVFCAIQGGYPGTANINSDPMFVDSANGDFHLQAGSPCIDTGDPNSPKDPDSTRADMGAFYFPQSKLMFSEDSLNFGLIDLGNDSVQVLTVSSYGPMEVVIQSLTWTQPNAFAVDTSQLNRNVAPHSQFELPVHFAPATAGTYHGQLQIIADQYSNDTVRIPLYGEAQIILPPVDSLVIVKGPLNGVQLHWSPVLHTITGRPVPPTIGYIVYGSETSVGPWLPFGYSTSNTYLHPYITRFRHAFFYYVTADPTAAETFKREQVQFPAQWLTE